MTKKLILIKGKNALNNQVAILETKAENLKQAKAKYKERFGENFKIQYTKILKTKLI